MYMKIQNDVILEIERQYDSHYPFDDRWDISVPRELTDPISPRNRPVSARFGASRLACIPNRQTVASMHRFSHIHR